MIPMLVADGLMGLSGNQIGIVGALNFEEAGVSIPAICRPPGDMAYTCPTCEEAGHDLLVRYRTSAGAGSGGRDEWFGALAAQQNARKAQVAHVSTLVQGRVRLIRMLLI